MLLAKGLCADKINDGGTGDGDGSGSGNIADIIFQDNIYFPSLLIFNYSTSNINN